MSDIQIHIGEILARNARMYPDDVALVERVAAIQNKGQKSPGRNLMRGQTGFRTS